LQSSRNRFSKYRAQLSVVPSTHCVASAKTPTGNSSLRHFLSNLHAIIFGAILFVASLICLIMIPRDPLCLPYFFFISSSNAFSFDLSSRSCVGSSPHDGSPVMYAIISTFIQMSFSSHRYPPWVTSISFLTYCLCIGPSQSVGCPTSLESHFLASLVAHWTGWLIGSPKGPIPTVCR
jgi:hypothetical protein